jgi:hypothetical protein
MGHEIIVKEFSWGFRWQGLRGVSACVLWDSAALAGPGVFDRLDNISYSFIV